MTEIHSWITAVLYPATNGIVAMLLLATYLRHRNNTALMFLGTSAALSFLLGILWFLLKIQKTYTVKIIPGDITPILWSVQALAEYLSIALFMIGILQLVRYFDAKTSVE